MNDEAYLRLLAGMAPGERKLFLRSESVAGEKAWLEQMLDTNRRLDTEANTALKMAEQYVYDYELHKEPQFLESAEFWRDLAKDMRDSKYSIKDIRKQREKIQWEVREMNRAKRSTERKPSSKTSIS